eukprot:jgi/Ulvmu1/5457/UM227_0002.1
MGRSFGSNCARAALLSIFAVSWSAGLCGGTFLEAVGTDNQYDMKVAGRQLQQQLLQQDGSVVSRRVGDATELIRAFRDGVNDIVITSHIDLTGFPQGAPGQQIMLPVVPIRTNMTIRGNCDDQQETDGIVEDAAVIALAPNACIIFTPGPVLATEGDTWLQNLAFQFIAPPGVQTVGPALIDVIGPGRLWVFDCAFEGDGVTFVSGLRVTIGGNAYVKDSIFRQLGGEKHVIRADAPLSLVNVLISQNMLNQTANGLPLALILISGLPLDTGAGPGLRMEAVTTINNPHPFTVAASSADTAGEIYSDREVSILIIGDNPDVATGEGLDAVDAQDLSILTAGFKTNRFISLRTPSFISRRDELQPLYVLDEDNLPTDEDQFEAQPEPPVQDPAAAPAGAATISPVNLTRVTTVEQLLAAVADGARDIHIEAHLDLSEAPIDDLGFTMSLLPTTRSIRGLCPSSVPIPPAVRDFGEALLDRPDQQCILSGTHGIFRMTQDNHYLWIDNVNLHSAPRGQREFGLQHRLLDVDGDGSKVWVTRCALHGAEMYSEAVMLWSETAAVHFDECRLVNFEVPLMSRAVVTSWGALSLSGLKMSALVARSNSTAVFFARDTGSITILRSEPCPDCSGNMFMVQDGGFFVSDQTATTPGSLPVWDFTGQEKIDPLELPPGRKPIGMLSMDDPWLASVQAALDSARLEAAVAPPGAPIQPEIRAPPPDFDLITNRPGLIASIEQGEQDIVLLDHIDLRGADLNEYGYILSPQRTTRSILGGTCMGPVPVSMLEANDKEWTQYVNPGQCVLLVDAGVFFIDQPNHHLWLDNLFIRFSSNVTVDDSDTAPAINGDNLSGDPRGIVVSSRGAAVYGTELTFHVGKTSRGGGFKVAALWDDASTVTFQDVEMYGFSVTRGQPAVISTWGAFSISDAIVSDIFIGEDMALFHTENFGAFRMQDITVMKRSGPGAIYLSPVALAGIKNDSGVFCDDEEQVMVSVFGPPEACQPLNTIQNPDRFGDTSDLWFDATLEAIEPALDDIEDGEVDLAAIDADSLPPITPVPVDEPPPATDDAAAADGGADASTTDDAQEAQTAGADVGGGGGGGGGNGTRIALIAVFGTLLPLILVAVAVWVVHRRHSKRESWAEFHDGMKSAENGTNGSAKIPVEATNATWANGGISDHGEATMQPLSVHSANGSAASSANGSALEALGPNPRGALFPTTAGKDPMTQVTPLAPLTLALDALCSNRGKFLDKYAPLGLAHRRLGRTAIVQIFEDPDTQRRYAIKFYRSRTSFDCERAAYGRTAVAEAVAVPQHGIITEPGTGPDGYRWPPCIVMDVGEPLDAFLGRVPRGDDATIRTALADIAAVIETLHSKGWAHRNLKPSNVLFLAEGERWVLCDLERCSRVGQTAPASPPCEYTAPEVWASMQTAQPSTVTAAADVWAVGALMFEAATGERVQQAGVQARAAAKGLYERAQTAEGTGALGVLAEMILDCLAVAPAARPTIRSIVPLLQAEVIEAKQNVEHVLDQLQALADDAQDYSGFRGYLQSVRACHLVPEPARSRLPEPPEESPGGPDMASLAKDYFMALGPDAVSFAKGIALKEERLHAFRTMNMHINDMLRRVAD